MEEMKFEDQSRRSNTQIIEVIEEIKSSNMFFRQRSQK